MVYDNVKVYSTEGELLFLGNNDRRDWYLKRNLAEPYLDGIRFLFQSKGGGHKGHPFYLNGIENKCVICGVTEDLTKHHIIPYAFRRRFPVKFKSYMSHDVLPLCENCHVSYEREADKFKKTLLEKYKVELQIFKDVILLRKCAYAYVEHRETIPADRLNYFKSIIINHFGNIPGDDDLREYLEDKPDMNYPYDLIVDKIEDFHDFMKMWRSHFIEFGKPRFLPKGWDVDTLATLVREEIEEQNENISG